VVLRLPDSWSNWNLKMLVFEESGKPKYPEKNLAEQRREPTNNKLNPHMVSTRGFEPGPHWWEASALTTAPFLAPPFTSKVLKLFGFKVFYDHKGVRNVAKETVICRHCFLKL